MRRAAGIPVRRWAALFGPAAMLCFWMASAFSGRAAAEAPAAPAGSAEYRPSPAHPMGWRGDGTGCFPAATPVTEWSATKNVRWHVAVGRGYASPIFAGDLVIVQAEPNLLVAVDRESGALRWRVEVLPADVAEEAGRAFAQAYQPPKDGSGLAAATPVTDGATIFAVFANGLVCAVDLEGKRRWTTAIAAEQNTAYGRAASPLLVDGRLIVHLTNLYALDPATGKQQWMNPDAKALYGSPAVMRAKDATVIVTPNGDVVSLGEGKTLKTEIAHANYASPLVHENVAYFADPAANGVRLAAGWQESEAWSATFNGDVFASPLFYDGLLFLLTGSGELSAFDTAAKDPSEAVIDAREIFPAGNLPVAYASPTLAGKYLFFISTKGEAVVLEATREAKLVSRNHLPAGTGATPIFSGNRLYLRDGDQLYCLAP